MEVCKGNLPIIQPDIELLRQLTKESETCIYVADGETDELLYVNEASRRVLHLEGPLPAGQTCYEYLMHRKTPCPFCHKSMFSKDKFLANIVKFPANAREYRIASKLIEWNNRLVHVHYIIDLTELMNKEKELRRLTDKIPTGIGVFIVYKDGRLEQSYLNDGYFAMLGTTRDARAEYLGFNTLNSMHPEDREVSRNICLEGIEKNQQINMDVRVLNGAGEYMWIHIRADIYEKHPDKTVLYCAFTDVDDLKKAIVKQKKSRKIVERLLAESQANEKKFQSIIANVPGAMVVFEVKNQMLWIKYISDACVNITGFTAEETYERSGSDPLRDTHPESRKYLVEHECQDIQKGGPITYRYRLMCKNGEYKWAALNLTPVEEQGTMYYYGFLRDLDAEEKKYLEQEGVYNQMVGFMERYEADNLIAKGRYDLDDNKLLYYQPVGGQAKVLPPNATFDSARDIMLQATGNYEQKKLLENLLNRYDLQKKYQLGREKGKLEYKRLQDDGVFFWSQLTYDMTVNPENGHIIFFVYTYDITKSVLERNMLEMLGNTEYEVLGTVDIKTHHYEIQAVAMHGVPFLKNHPLASGNYDKTWEMMARERVPEYEQDIFINNTRIDNIIAHLERQGSYFITYSILDLDNTYHRKKLQYCYLDDSKETLFYFRSDITAIYANEQEQIRKTEHALEMARQANAAKTEFFSRMSHDMRTPMNGILGLAELASSENSIEAQKENIRKIKESGEYLLSLINDTLDLQRIESGRLSLNYQPVYAPDLVSNVMDMIRPSLEQKNIQLNIDNSHMNEDCYLILDPIRTRQIFMNILSNAIKFTPDGGRVDVVAKRLKQENNRVEDVVTIRDSGVGMSEDFMKNHLFKPFSQENNKESAKYAGSGLGLSIVHSLVGMMGGKIEVESQLGEGTCFKIYLQFELLDKETVAKENLKREQQEHVLVQNLQGVHVLLAEDNSLNAEICTKLLEKIGCQVTCASNGQECLDLFTQNQPGTFDIILMDIRMPVLDGLEATKSIRQLPREEATTIPIFAMTANAYEEDVNKSLEAGMNGHLSKPIVPNQMYETIAKALKK